MRYGADPERASGRQQVVLAVVFLVTAVATSYFPDGLQQEIAAGVRTTVLRPFIGAQELLTAARLRGAEIEVLREEVDSLSASLLRQRGLVEENATLRAVLGLGERLGPSWRPASVLRPRTPGSESIFILDIGEDDGVRPDAPVVDYRGLVGVVREVEPGRSLGIDWTHPDFRASAMLADGSAYGIVENRRGAFREADRLVLNGTAYNQSWTPGTRVVTSGLGPVFPRGIPIGRLSGVENEQAGWLRSYWIDPMVEPGAVTHVLVAIDDPDTLALERAWSADSLAIGDMGTPGNPR